MERAQVAVIGGGAAGVAALEALHAAGCDALLLEARDRLGGRLHTVQPEGWPAPVELGAEFIHGAPAELAAVAAEGAEAGRQDWNWRDGKLEPAGEFGGGAGRVLELMAAVRPPAPDRSFAAFLAGLGDAVPETAKVAARGYIEGYEAADPEWISVYSLNRERNLAGTGGGEPRRPRAGFAALVREMARNGRIHLGTEATGVEWRPGHVRVRTRGREGEAAVEARAAIVTLPLALLQAQAVRFEPGLTAKRGALELLAMGAALRVTLRMREPIWREARDAGGQALDRLGFLFGAEPGAGHFPVWWTHPGAAQITGWAAGRQAVALAGWPEVRLWARAIADLAARLGLPERRIAGALIEAHTHDWQTDRFAGGGYSYACVGGWNAAAELAAPLERTLFFAGEATEGTGEHATVQGAIRSGRRAAREVLSLAMGI
jgi:monoamine oxidase